MNAPRSVPPVSTIGDSLSPADGVGLVLPELVDGVPQPTLKDVSVAPPKAAAITPAEALQHISRTLPLGVELHRSDHFVFPLGNRRKLDLLVLKIHCPEEREYQFQTWRSTVAPELDPVSILVRRVRGTQNLWNNLSNRFSGKALLTKHDGQEIREMLASVCGERPRCNIPTVQRDPSRKDLTRVPFIAPDGPGVRDIEDLVYARVNPDGSLLLRVAIIDATDYVQPGNELDSHALRVGSTLYTRYHTVPTLPPELAHDLLSFHQGKVRPAWVLDVKLSPTEAVGNSKGIRARHYELRYGVTRAYVRNHRNIDPTNVPALDAKSPFARSLGALSEVARILRHRRASKPTPIRVDGTGPLHMIVSEVMIEAKTLLSDFVGRRHGLPMIYRVHERPSRAVRERFHLALNALKIPNTIDDLSNPSQFAGILGSLEQRRDAKSQALLNDLLDTFLLRSLLSVDREIGHFGLNVPYYGNWKPRDADGLANQHQLRAIAGMGRSLTATEVAARAERLNQKRWTRDERTFNAIFLESLESRLALTDTITTGIVHETYGDRVTVLMNGFSKPGELLRIPKNVSLEPGAPVVAVVRGFHLEKRAWEFALKL